MEIRFRRDCIAIVGFLSVFPVSVEHSEHSERSEERFDRIDRSIDRGGAELPFDERVRDASPKYLVSQRTILDADADDGRRFSASNDSIDEVDYPKAAIIPARNSPVSFQKRVHPWRYRPRRLPPAPRRRSSVCHYHHTHSTSRARVPRAWERRLKCGCTSRQSRLLRYFNARKRNAMIPEAPY